MTNDLAYENIRYSQILEITCICVIKSQFETKSGVGAMTEIWTDFEYVVQISGDGITFVCLC